MGNRAVRPAKKLLVSLNQQLPSREYLSMARPTAGVGVGDDTMTSEGMNCLTEGKRLRSGIVTFGNS